MATAPHQNENGRAKIAGVGQPRNEYVVKDVHACLRTGIDKRFAYAVGQEVKRGAATQTDADRGAETEIMARVGKRRFTFSIDDLGDEFTITQDADTCDLAGCYRLPEQFIIGHTLNAKGRTTYSVEQYCSEHALRDDTGRPHTLADYGFPKTVEEDFDSGGHQS